MIERVLGGAVCSVPARAARDLEFAESRQELARRRAVRSHRVEEDPWWPCGPCRSGTSRRLASAARDARPGAWIARQSTRPTRRGPSSAGSFPEIFVFWGEGELA